jgi:hypothetical protein
MVFLAVTRAGFDRLVAQLGKVPSPLWLGAGVLSEAEVERLREAGVDLSVFIYELGGPDSDRLDQAAETVEEHHPGQRLWVEGRSEF